jgi:hypothetical protein
MRGDVMEACSCATTCPCNLGSDPIPLPCEVVIGWRIANGHYGNTQLDGLNVVLYGRIPGNAFQGNWTVGVYLDERADQQQAQAFGNIFSGQAGGWPSVLGALIGNLLTTKRVPIRFETVNGDYHITVPGLLEVGSEPVPNPFSGQPPLDPKVSDLAVPFYTGAVRVRRSRTLKLTDPDMGFEYSAARRWSAISITADRNKTLVCTPRLAVSPRK